MAQNDGPGRSSTAPGRFVAPVHMVKGLAGEGEGEADEGGIDEISNNSGAVGTGKWEMYMCGIYRYRRRISAIWFRLLSLDWGSEPM